MKFKRFIALLLILALFSVLVPTSFAEDGETFYVDSHSKEDMDKWIKFGVVVAKIR